MTASATTSEWFLERVLAAVMLAVFWAAFSSLAAGLMLSVWHPRDDLGAELLNAGLLALLTMPILRLLTAVVSAARCRDWLTMGATLAVLGILFALTLRDAVRFR